MLPRACWPNAVFGPYNFLVRSHPVMTTFISCALDLFVGVGAVCLGDMEYVLRCVVSVVCSTYRTANVGN